MINQECSQTEDDLKTRGEQLFNAFVDSKNFLDSERDDFKRVLAFVKQAEDADTLKAEIAANLARGTGECCTHFQTRDDSLRGMIKHAMPKIRAFFRGLASGLCGVRQ